MDLMNLLEASSPLSIKTTCSRRPPQGLIAISIIPSIKTNHTNTIHSSSSNISNISAKMKFFHFLALPALAAAAVMVERQTAGGVQVVTARSISNDQGSGCPQDHFGVAQKGDYITLHLDMYRTELYPTNRSDVRNRFCDVRNT